MAHILLVQYPASGHINPTLPVVSELVRRGHQVSCVVPEHYRGIVEPTGARVLPYPSLIPPMWTGVTIPRHPDADAMAQARVNMVRETLTPLPSIVEDLGDDRPDIVIYDVLGSAAGRLLSLAWEVPSVVTCPTFVENETFSPYAAAVLDGDMAAPDPDHPSMREASMVVRTSLDTWGLERVSVTEFLSGADEQCRMVFLPREFQPNGDNFDDRFEFVGPCLRTGADDGGWTPPASGRPVVLISLGTLGYKDAQGLLSGAIVATREIGAHAVVSIGDLDPTLFGASDENIELHRRVPQLAVLRHADGFISHAGMNSTMESLAHGVPLVDLPQTGEQRLVADQVSTLGLGRALDPDTATSDQIAAALDEVRTDVSVARCVQSMQMIIRSSGGAVAAADVVESRLSITSPTKAGIP